MSQHVNSLANLSTSNRTGDGYSTFMESFDYTRPENAEPTRKSYRKRNKTPAETYIADMSNTALERNIIKFAHYQHQAFGLLIRNMSGFTPPPLGGRHLNNNIIPTCLVINVDSVDMRTSVNLCDLPVSKGTRTLSDGSNYIIIFLNYIKFQNFQT